MLIQKKSLMKARMMKQNFNLKFVFKILGFLFVFLLHQDCSALVFKVTAENGAGGYKSDIGHFGPDPEITHFPKGETLVVSEKENWQNGSYILVKDSKSSREIWVNSSKGEKRPYANSYALLIGAWDYPGTDDDLHFVKQDIGRLKNKLKKIGFEDEEKIRVLTKPEETNRSGIIPALHKLKNQAGPEDRVLIAYAGHGQTIDDLGYIVPTNVSPAKEKFSHFISMADIQAIYKKIDARHLFLVFDSCFSGALFEESKGGDHLLPNEFNSTSQYLKENTSRKARQALTAGTSDQTVPSDGPFMLAFVDAISTLKADGDKNKIITGTEVMNWVKNNTGSSLTPDSGPLTGHQRGDFVFFDAQSSIPELEIAEPPPIILLGHLQVNVNASGSRVFVDSEFKGDANPGIPLRLKNLPSGSHTVRVEAEQFNPLEKPVSVRRGEWIQEVFELAKKPVKKKFRRLTPPGMAKIPAGSFMMGADAEVCFRECQKYYGACKRSWCEDEEPRHKVYVDEFFMDKYEVTQEDFERVMGANPSGFKGAKRPVDSVTWDEAKEYCEKVGKRLPTEAEWEKAAKGVEDVIYPWGNSFESGYGNFCDKNCEHKLRRTEFNDGYKNTAPTGHYKANKYGLYDMGGNVWEWVADWYDAGSYKGREGVRNPEGPDNGKKKVLRGGSWSHLPYILRAASRYRYDPTVRINNIGFRCSQ